MRGRGGSAHGPPGEMLVAAVVLSRLIDTRRDVRAFRPDPIPDATLRRILVAAHHAPSVGFMQPWNFIIIRDPLTKARVKASRSEEHTSELQSLAYLVCRLLLEKKKN